MKKYTSLILSILLISCGFIAEYNANGMLGYLGGVLIILSGLILLLQNKKLLF